MAPSFDVWYVPCKWSGDALMRYSGARIQQPCGVSVCQTRGYAYMRQTRVGYVSNTPRGVLLTK